MSCSKETERRKAGIDRRREERRRSMRYAVGTLLVVDGVTWVDDEGNDRRRKVRRRGDRERLARKILDEFSG